MNRLLLTIIAFIYLGLSVRATIHLHDCMDIFAGAATDTHTKEKEQSPCKNDPSQCKMETQRRVIEAPSKWLRDINEALVPVSAFRFIQNFYIFHESFYGSYVRHNLKPPSLLSLFCLWRI